MLRLIYFFLFSEYAVLKGNEEKFSMRTKISALVSFENRKVGKPMVDADISHNTAAGMEIITLYVTISLVLHLKNMVTNVLHF